MSAPHRSGLSRRTLAKAGGWAVPAVAAAAAAPAVAASSCSGGGEAIDEALARLAQPGAVTAYLSEATAASGDGVTKSVWLNFINNTPYALEISSASTFSVTFHEVPGKSSVTARPYRPTAGTSWGKTTEVTQSSAPNGRASWTWTWTAGSRAGAVKANVKGVGTGNRVNMSWGTGPNIMIGGVVVAMTLDSVPTVLPTLQSITAVTGVDVSGCGAYLESRSAVSLGVALAGPKISDGSAAVYGSDGKDYTLTGGAYPWAVGSTYWSNDIGNYISDTNPPRKASVDGYSNGVF